MSRTAHLEWDAAIDHQSMLQEKLNAYLAHVESGDFQKQYPKAKNKKIVFNIVFKYKPDRDGYAFLRRAQQFLQQHGFALRYELFAESYDN